MKMSIFVPWGLHGGSGMYRDEMAAQDPMCGEK
jgi:hypothetical protein